MINQVLILSRVQLKNLFGINEIRYSKDKKKKRNFLLLSIAYAMLILMGIGYVVGLVFGLHTLGMGDIAPMYLYTVLSLLMLVFSFFKAGSVLFSMKAYDICISLPVTKSALLISRFVTMYVTNLLLVLFVMIPGLVVHVAFARPGVSFYCISIAAIVFAPLLPLTIASILGALIKGISSRMKRKNLVEVGLTLVIVIPSLIAGFFLEKPMESMDMEAMKELVSLLTETLGKIFPPALWYHNALCGNILEFLFLLLLPSAIFLAFVWILAKNFTKICTGLNATYARNNYKLTSLKTEQIPVALFKKEMKLYFSSSLYVTNTIIGYILALVMAAAIAVLGVDALAEYLELPAYVSILKQLLPLALILPFCMMSASSCSISMEGKTFWQVQVLPIRARDIYNAKLLWNLTLCAPFYLISVSLLLIGGKPEFKMALHYVLLPFLFMVYSIVLGLACNLRFPLFHWDNEARVIKQSASVGMTMLFGMLSILLAAIPVVLMPPDAYFGYFFAVEAVLLGLTLLLYSSICKKDLVTIA